MSFSCLMITSIGDFTFSCAIGIIAVDSDRHFLSELMGRWLLVYGFAVLALLDAAAEEGSVFVRC